MDAYRKVWLSLSEVKLKGWIKLHRSIMNKGWFRNRNVVFLWVYCLLKATHKPVTVTVGFQQVPLQAGQFVFGRKKAAEETGLSEREIRTCLEFLKKAGSLTIKPTNKFSIITLVNWWKYQGNLPQGDQQTTSKRPQTRSRRSLSGKEKKNLRSALGPQLGGFLSFWDQAFRKKYGTPYSGNRGKDRARVRKLLKHHSPERLQELGKLFFDSPDPFIQKSDHSIGIFYSQIYKLNKRKAAER